jgi:D-alanine--poly(phosphoribitol) ligase subunit 1
VRDAVVLPVQRQGVTDSLAAFVILGQRPAEPDTKLAIALRTRLGERVPAYMVPRKVVFLDTFPMNANGKADRRRLAELLHADSPRGRPAVAESAA